MKKLMLILMACIVCLLFTGCTTISIISPDGTRVNACAFLTDFDKVIGDLAKGTFEIDGAKTQAQVIADSVIKGAVMLAAEQRKTEMTEQPAMLPIEDRRFAAPPLRRKEEGKE